MEYINIVRTIKKGRYVNINDVNYMENIVMDMIVKNVYYVLRQLHIIIRECHINIVKITKNLIW